MVDGLWPSHRDAVGTRNLLGSTIIAGRFPRVFGGRRACGFRCVSLRCLAGDRGLDRFIVIWHLGAACLGRRIGMIVRLGVLARVQEIAKMAGERSFHRLESRGWRRGWSGGHGDEVGNLHAAQTSKPWAIGARTNKSLKSNSFGEFAPKVMAEPICRFGNFSLLSGAFLAVPEYPPPPWAY